MSYEKTLLDFLNKIKVEAEIVSTSKESPFLIFDIVIKSGSYKKIERNSTEMALAFKAISSPNISTITSKGIVRIEIMIDEMPIIYFNELIPKNKHLPLLLGSSFNGEHMIEDLKDMPHLLIGGSTGSGKSVLLHSIINGLILYSDCEFALIDPKRVEFSHYENNKRLFAPIARDVPSSLNLLEELVQEMEMRFSILEKYGCRDKMSYSGKMPHIVVVIDELADLMMSAKKKSHNLICRLAQKSRACGIHIIAATQRPSVDVVTGVIKANFPSRISCKVISSTDSRTIINKNGAEKLIGKGDSIIFSPKYEYKRFKGAFIKSEEIGNNVGW